MAMRGTLAPSGLRSRAREVAVASPSNVRVVARIISATPLRTRGRAARRAERVERETLGAFRSDAGQTLQLFDEFDEGLGERHVRFQISDFRFQISDCRLQISD